MQKTKTFSRTRFSQEVIQEALRTHGVDGDGTGKDERLSYSTLRVANGREAWEFDTLDEFYSELNSPYTSALLTRCVVTPRTGTRSISIDESTGSIRVSVEATERSAILKTLSVFENRAEQSRLPPEPSKPPAPKPRPKIFIGHGRSSQWRTIKDHLTDQHRMDVTAYEVGARAGHTIRDILDDMLNDSSFAILVMTGEDETAEGSVRARQNVIHETGLFQGRLGFSKAIVVAEEGVEMYTNLDGVQQIRYPKERIKETLGDLVATINREFKTKP